MHACRKDTNKTNEDLGDFLEHIFNLIDTSIEFSSQYRSISRRFVQAALRESRLRPDELLFPKHRRQFIKILEAQGNPVDFLLFSRLTSGTTPRRDGVKHRSYILTLELVDVKTGDSDKESTRIRKADAR